MAFAPFSTNKTISSKVVSMSNVRFGSPLTLAGRQTSLGGPALIKRGVILHDGLGRGKRKFCEHERRIESVHSRCTGFPQTRCDWAFANELLFFLILVNRNSAPIL